MEMLSSVEIMKAEIASLKVRYLGESPSALSIRRARLKILEREVDKIKSILNGMEMIHARK